MVTDASGCPGRTDGKNLEVKVERANAVKRFIAHVGVLYEEGSCHPFWKGFG
jgi:hypothetical protein